MKHAAFFYQQKPLCLIGNSLVYLLYMQEQNSLQTLFSEFSASDKGAFYLSLSVLVAAFAVNAVWLEGQELATDYDEAYTANVMAMVRAKALSRAREAELQNLDLGDLDAEMSSLESAEKELQ